MAIGDVSVRVVPDATDFWRQFEARTSAGNHDVRVRVVADTSQARAQIDSLNKSSRDSTFQMHALRDAIALIGPAAVPIAAVATGAIAGLIPVLAAAGLGVKGIVDDYKNGSLQASKFGQDISVLQGELHSLEQTAAGGLLNGLHTSLRALQPAFEEVNRDTAVMSQQLGQVVGHIAPGFVRLLTELNPLFVTLGDELVRGAKNFQHWAASSDGVSKFVAYVQTELPTVEHDLGQLVELASRLIAGFAPFGHVALSSLGVLAQVLNAMPLDVLSKLETGAIAVYAAFRTYSAITGIVNSVNGAIIGFQARQTAAAAATSAAALQIEAASAQEAAAVAEANAVMAASAAESAAAIAASVEGTASVLAAEATAAAEAAIEFSAAMAAEAESAAAAATEITAAAEAAAAGVAEAGSAASLGFAGLLGPIGAVIAGVGILAATFISSSNSTRGATQTVNDYTNALLQSNGAITENIRQLVAQQLAQSHTLEAARSLGISLSDLTDAALGQPAALRKVNAVLDAVSANFKRVEEGGKASGSANVVAAANVKEAIDGQNASMKEAVRQYRDIHQASKQAADGANSVALAHHRAADALHVLGDAYNEADAAAKKSTAQARAQTLQFQLENDAASLLDAALQKLAGHGLSAAEAQTALRQANLAVRQSFKQNKTAIEGGSAAAVANQQALQGQAQAAIQVAEQVGKATKSSKDETQSLKDSKAAIEDQLRSRNQLTPAVQAYINKLYDLKNLKVPPTVLDVKKQAADQAIAALKQEINNIRQDHSPELKANPGIAENAIRELQHEIDAIRQGHVPPVNVDTGGANSALDVVIGKLQTIGRGASATITVHTSTGTLHIPQAAGTQSVFGQSTIPPNTAFTVGERGWEGGVTDSQGRASIFPAAQALALGFTAPRGYAAGTDPNAYIVEGTRYASLQAAKNAAKADFKANVHLGIQIEHQGFKDWEKALDGTVAQAHAAFEKILSEAKKLGAGNALVQHLQDQNKKLDIIVGKRDDLRKALGTAPAPTTEYDKLASAIDKVHAAMQALRQEAQTVRDAVKSVFDITTAGTGPNGDQSPTGGAIVAQEMQDARRAREFVRDIKQLAGTIPGPYLTELASKGPDALPQAEALLDLSNSQKKELRRAYQQIDQSAGSLGKFISNRDNRDDIKAAQKRVNEIKNRIKEMKEQIHHDNDRIANKLDEMKVEFVHHIDELSRRPVVVKTPNGTVLWRAVEEGRREARR